MAAGDDAAVAEIKKAITKAAKKVAEADTIEEATKWQGIQNQQQASLDKLRNAG